MLLLRRPGSIHLRTLETSGAARTKSLATDSSSIHRPISAYETGDHEFSAPGQSPEATGRSALPRELTAARTSVQRSDAKTPSPMASTTACCSVAPRPILLGIHEKKRISRLAGIPGNEVSSVLIIMMRSTPAAIMDSLTVAMFAESNAGRSCVVAVTPRVVSTTSVRENASVRAAPSARDSTTTTRERPGTSVMRSGRERTTAVKSIPSERHTLRMPWPRPPAAPMTATWRGSSRCGLIIDVVVTVKDVLVRSSLTTQARRWFFDGKA